MEPHAAPKASVPAATAATSVSSNGYETRTLLLCKGKRSTGVFAGRAQAAMPKHILPHLPTPFALGAALCKTSATASVCCSGSTPSCVTRLDNPTLQTCCAAGEPSITLCVRLLVAVKALVRQ